MSQEQALALFAQCYNDGDFARLIAKLHRDCALDWYDHFYRQQGRERVGEALQQRANRLRAQVPPNRAHRGFEIGHNETLGVVQLHPCVVLTDGDDRLPLGVVRIRCGLLSIKSIVVGDPAKHKYTRGDYYSKTNNAKAGTNYG